MDRYPIPTPLEVRRQTKDDVRCLLSSQHWSVEWGRFQPILNEHPQSLRSVACQFQHSQCEYAPKVWLSTTMDEEAHRGVVFALIHMEYIYSQSSIASTLLSVGCTPSSSILNPKYSTELQRNSHFDSFTLTPYY